MEARIISLDVWGNAEEGYEINDTYSTGHRFDIPAEALNHGGDTWKQALLDGCKACGYLGERVTLAYVDIVEVSDDLYEVVRASDGFPICHIEIDFDGK